MCIVEKITSELEINAPAEEFYKVFKQESFKVPEICQGSIQKVEIQEEDWGKYGQGSLKTWYYTVDGKAEVFKERVGFDDQKLVVFMIGVEGDVFKVYKTFNAKYQVVSKGPNHSLVIMTLEYVKSEHGSPDPYNYLSIMNKITKGIESHLK